MLYNPITIANYFIQKAFDEGISMTPMKILKLVYIANGWYLGYRGESLISERSQAWQYGPVISSVYDAFKCYGRFEIQKMFLPNEILQNELKKLMEDKYVSTFLNSVWNIYKKYTGIQLSELTHQNNTPWSQTYHKFGSFTTIPNDLIETHYKEKISTAKVNG
jgi:uncharacterized phage-associated protein